MEVNLPSGFSHKDLLIVLARVGGIIYRKYSDWLLPSLQQQQQQKH